MLWRCSTLAVLVVLLGAGTASGQAAAEYAGAVAKMGAAAQSAKKLNTIPSLPAIFWKTSSQKQSGFAHSLASTGGAGEVTNRQALEEKAGKDAAKLMLRSVPTGAKVQIDGKVVGKTPLLLILAPGGYKVEMQGTRNESGQRQVGLLPKESREVLLPLQHRYPSRVRLRLNMKPVLTP